VPQSDPISIDFKLSILDQNERKFRGVAHTPTLDREHEVILTEAIKKALPYFMELPIIHLNHTERPIGIVKSAKIAEDQLIIEGYFKKTKDADDVWGEVLAGRLNKFSIYGRRLEGSPECSVDPNLRNQPCITKAIWLDSISVCGDNAINPNTFLDIVKSFESKAETTGSSLTHNTVDGTRSNRKMALDGLSMPENDMVASRPVETSHDDVKKCPVCNKEAKEVSKGPEEEEEKDDDRVEKSDPIMAKLDKVIATLEKLVESDKKVHSTMEKSEMTEEKKEPEKVEEVQKAVIEEKPPKTPKPKTEEIVKAELETVTKAFDDRFSEFKKAYDGQFDEIKKAHADLKAEVEKMKTETIQKGGQVVIIPEQAGSPATEDMLANIRMINKTQGGK